MVEFIEKDIDSTNEGMPVLGWQPNNKFNLLTIDVDTIITGSTFELHLLGYEV